MGKKPEEPEGLDALIAAVNTLQLELDEEPLTEVEELLVRRAYKLIEKHAGEGQGESGVALLRKRILALRNPNSVNN